MLAAAWRLRAYTPSSVCVIKGNVKDSRFFATIIPAPAWHRWLRSIVHALMGRYETRYSLPSRFQVIVGSLREPFCLL